MSVVLQSIREFRIVFNKYYWLTALMIAQNAITRNYRNSFLGIVWMVVQPLVQVLIFAIVMPMIMRFPAENYLLFLASSYSLWGYISSTLIGSSISIIVQAETLKRCIVSSTVFPIADVLRNFYTFILSFSIMFLFCSLFVKTPSWAALMLPIYIFPIMVILMAGAVAVSFMAPYMRDITELLSMVINIMFWLTPVVYPLDIVPHEYRQWLWLNPFFVMLQPFYQIIYLGQVPDMTANLAIFGLMIGSVVAGYSIYRACRKNYVYYL